MNNFSPIFIVAPVRSGSTFLRLMLDSHPEITNPGECDFLFDLVSDSGEMPEIIKYHEWLSINRIFQSKNIDIDKSLNYKELMDSFVKQFQKPEAVLSMNVHCHFQRIPHVFPNARYIHLLRDPRDVARSCIGMGWVGNVYYGVDIWADAEKSWDKLKVTLRPEQHIEVRYEELLNDIEKVLGEICDFYGVEYTNKMLSYADNSSYELPNKNLSYQWKKKYSNKELRLVEGKVSGLLLDRGYELSGTILVKPGLVEKFRLMFQNKLYRVQHSIKSYGWVLYIKNLIANKLGIKPLINSCKREINAINLKGLK